ARETQAQRAPDARSAAGYHYYAAAQFHGAKLGLEHLHDVVAHRLGNFLEPVRNARGDHDHIAFGHVVRLAAFDAGADGLVGLGPFQADNFASRDQRGFAVHDVHDVGLFVVDLDTARLVAMAAGDLEGRVVGERPALSERGGDFVV